MVVVVVLRRRFKRRDTVLPAVDEMIARLCIYFCQRWQGDESLNMGYCVESLHVSVFMLCFWIVSSIT